MAWNELLTLIAKNCNLSRLNLAIGVTRLTAPYYYDLPTLDEQPARDVQVSMIRAMKCVRGVAGFKARLLYADSHLDLEAERYILGNDYVRGPDHMLVEDDGSDSEEEEYEYKDEYEFFGCRCNEPLSYDQRLEDNCQQYWTALGQFSKSENKDESDYKGEEGAGAGILPEN